MKTIYPLLFLTASVAGGAQLKTGQIQQQPASSPVAERAAPPMPAFTYAFDDSFLQYFGFEGTMRVHSAVQGALNKGILDIEEVLAELKLDTTWPSDLRSSGEPPPFRLWPE